MSEVDEIIDKLIVNAMAIGEIEQWGESDSRTYLLNHHREIVDACIKHLKEKINHD